MSRRMMIAAPIGAALLILLVIKLTVSRSPAPSHAATPPPDRITLGGIVRDFPSSHPDFACPSTGPSTGHCVRNVHPTLASDRRPTYIGAGVRIGKQWTDKDENPIRPYATDAGLPGGHFDVDVFDEATDKELYHEHQFDDKFDVTYVDIANDPKLLFNDIIGPSYPNALRVEFVNAHHGSGVFTFEAGTESHSTNTQHGFETTFLPAELTQFRIDFASLLDLRGTSPGTVQDDIVDRDDSLSVRMYDVTTDALVYELAIYHHVKNGDDHSGGGHITGDDECGDPISDDIGTYAGANNGGVEGTASFQQWFQDEMGVNLSKGHAIELVRNHAGVYEYLDESFFPIDDQLLGNESASHNHLFTYAISAVFTFDACTDRFFEFEGNDDCWVFIDNAMVIDLGGTATPERQYIALDRLELNDGETYRLDFFFAHRCPTPSSRFRMRTNLELRSIGGVPISGGYD